MTRQMRIMLVIAGTSLRRIVADRSFAVFLVAMPLVIIAILGITLRPLMSSEFKPVQPFKVAVAQTGSHSVVMSTFESQPHLVDARLSIDGDEARSMVLQRTVDAAVIVPGAYPDQPVTMIAAPGGVVAGVLEEILRGVAVEIEDVKTYDVSIARTEVPSTNGVNQSGLPQWLNQSDSFGYYAVAVTAMFAMFAAHTAMVASARDRASDTYARIRTLSVTPASYMIATAVTSLVVAALFVTVLTAATTLLFGVHWGHLGSWLLLTLVGAAAIAGVSLVVTALIRSADHVEGAGNAIFNILAFLGGSMAPLHAMPEWFRSSLAWIPNRALLTGYLKLAQGADVTVISSELLSLAIATVVLFTLGWVILRVRTTREGH